MISGGGPVRAIVAVLLIAGVAISADSAAAQRGKKRAVTCAPQYEPVCARTSLGALATYTNGCFAGADGAMTIAKGSCKDIDCPLAELPVCGREGGANRIYRNVCIAEKEGAMVVANGSCPEECSDTAAWVCAVDETGKRGDYANACRAAFAGARVLHPGKCVARRPCKPDGVRVCAIDARTAARREYANLCLSEVANAVWVRRGRCEPGRLRKLFVRRGAQP